MFIPLRDDGPRSRIPVATLTLCAINVAVFAVQQLLPQDTANALLYGGGAIPWEIANLTDLVDGSLHPQDVLPPPFTIFTAMFLHGGIEHLAGNVWFLWVFGDNVEDAMGARRFLAFYFAAGLAASLAQIVMTPESRVPIVGASGAIAGVLGAFLFLYPRARVEVLLFLIVILEIVIAPAFVVLSVWFLWQILANRADGSVATWAHVWGFLVGVGLCKLFTLRSGLGRLPRPAPAPSEGYPWPLTTASASSSSLP